MPCGGAEIRAGPELGVQAVFANHDDEPRRWSATPRCAARWPMRRDPSHLQGPRVFERDEVLTKAGQPYTVFTPYKNAWLAKVDDFYLKPYPGARHADALAPCPRPTASRRAVPSLPRSVSSRPTCRRWRFPPAAQGAGALFEDFLERIDRYDADARLPGVQGAQLPGRAPALRHGVDPAAGRVAHQRAQGNARARRPG
jgi:deoxyribodipyrimidine photo-lyase